MFRNLPFALKLMLTLVLTVFIAVGAVALLANRSAERHFRDYVSLEMRPRVLAFVPLLAEYYAAQGSWAGVEEVLAQNTMGGMGMMRGRGGQQMAAAMNPILADAQGRVIYDPLGRYTGRKLSARILGGGQAITVGGQVVGYLVAGAGPQEQEFIDRLNTSILWAGGLTGLIAILLGLLLTRAVTSPLRVVRGAARRIGAGDLAYRVPVTTRDEIGDVARQFNEMAAALERDEQLRRKMTADIAHELRTPLTVMRGQIEALQDGVFALTTDNLAPIHDQVLLLGRLVNDLRDLALAEAGRLPLERSEVALDALIERVANAFRPRAQERDQTLTTELPDTLPPVQADAQRMEQVLGNLLSNALRHAPAGGNVTIRAWAEPEWVGFAVQDDGPGIAPEDLPHVFDRFYRADPSRSRADGGIGLGLSIVKQLVEAHGGRVEVQNAPGQGATFTVHLPVGKG